MRRQVRAAPRFQAGMRLRRVGALWLAAIAGFGVLGVQTAAAQADPRDFCGGGQIVVVRSSRITAAGSREGFDQAVRAQLAWYRDHGFAANRLITADVIVQNPKSRAWSKSPNEVMSLHINPPPIAEVKPDAAWNAFVARFKENAAVEIERTLCLNGPLN